MLSNSVISSSVRYWLGRFTLLIIGWVCGLSSFGGVNQACFAEPSGRPNVIIILADDVGYGDLGCYGATEVETPHIDRLARAGRRFTDAHSPSSVCTPTRYALLTGQYAWRHKPAAGILSGVSPLCIPVSGTTLAIRFQASGYEAAAVGKWHLGLGGERLPDGTITGQTDYNREIKPGPLEIGFSSFFGVPATGDRTPCVYVEDRRVVGYDPNDPIQVSYGTPIGNDPTGKANPELMTILPSHGHDNTIVNGISRIGYMSGGKSARWVDTEMADVLTRAAVQFIERERNRPFFLYFCTHDIHVPRVPHPRYADRSGHGARGDVIMQLDGSVGEILASLERADLAKDTLVIFTSDNGGVLDDGYQDGAAGDLGAKRPNGDWRGFKGSLFEGGHRVPFIARWPGHVPVGVSDQLICHVDLFATCAALLGRTLTDDEAPDSYNALPALLGKPSAVRDKLVHHTGGYPGVLALRDGPWKLLQSSQAGYGGKPDREPMLVNLADDPGEKHNLAAQMPEKVQDMQKELAELREHRRSRP
ncbi:MAG TPA: arylsulfatase [Pirellulales bacterium]|jgi:arylsulfatase A-like enzyme